MTTNETPKNKFLQPGRVKVIQGSIVAPHNAGLRFVLNIANMTGKTDGAIYAVFDKKWPKIKQEVRGAYVQKTGKYQLGSVACVTAVQSDVWAVSLLCQDDKGITDVAALQKCLAEVRKMAQYERSDIHVSTILTKEIPELQGLLKQELVDFGVSVSYYEEPGKP